MVKSPIKVLVRTRPTPNFGTNIEIDDQAGQVNVTVPKNEAQGYVNHQQENWNFKFDKVLHNSSQEAVFESSAKELLLSALEGYSGTVLCYGQTGAGKTYTMNGEPLKLDLKGIIPRTIHELFKEIQDRGDQNITLRISYVEIYNESISDLLDSGSNTNITVNEDAKKGISLKGITYKVCKNEKEALRCLLQGNLNRTVSANALNPNSSRSHAIFTIYLEMRSRIELNEKIIYSKINLVDLAGSERTKKTKSEGRTLVEANYINKSLFFLEQMVVALSEKQREHVPYRHSKLTYLLKDSIGGNSKTLMIANILPEITHLEETISTLRFATRMMKVSNEAQINVKVDPNVLIKKYETEIQQLKRELVTQSVFGNKTPVPAPNERFTPEQKQSHYKIAKGFLKGEIEEVEIESISHAKALIKQFRRAHKNLCKQIRKTFASRVLESSGNETLNCASDSKLSCDFKSREDVKKSDQVKRTSQNRKKQKNNKTSLEKHLTEEDIKNLTTNISTGEDSSEGIQTEVDVQQDPEKKSYYVSSIQKVGEFEKTEIFSQSNTYEDREVPEDILKGSNILSEKINKSAAPSKCSVGSKEDLQDFKDLIQKPLETKSLQYIQDMTPRSFTNDVIRTENDLRHPRKKFKQEAEKIQELKFTIHLINQNIHQAKSMLYKQFDAYQKKGYSIAMRAVDQENVAAEAENILSQSCEANPANLGLKNECKCCFGNCFLSKV